MSEQLPALHAATLVLFDEREPGPARLLMIERASQMSFAGGAVVFPGGRVEEDDRLVAQRYAIRRDDPDQGRGIGARVAAIRETIEEVGVAVGLDPIPTPALLREWRERLARQEPFSELLREADAVVDLDELVGFARWCPNLGGHKRFDTRFYLARTTHAGRIEVDGGETARHLWMTAQQVLDDADAGHHRIIFPTRRNLERLAAYPSFDAAVAHARSITPATISPWIADSDGEKWLCIPDNLGYPVTRAPLDQALKN